MHLEQVNQWTILDGNVQMIRERRHVYRLRLSILEQQHVFDQSRILDLDTSQSVMNAKYYVTNKTKLLNGSLRPYRRN